MKPTYLLALLVAGALAAASHAHAHGYAGDHLMISTLLIDDPFMADEASLPTFSYLPQSGSDPVPNQYMANIEFDKRITETFGLGKPITGWF